MTKPPVELISEIPNSPRRPDAAHKGTFGRVLVIAGSRGMSGAAGLSGLGALRGGAGLVTVAVPRGILATVAGIEPSYLTIPLPEDDEGRIIISGGEESILTKTVAENDAIVVGPGWGRSDNLVDLAGVLYKTVEQPMVFDADSLNALATNPTQLNQHHGSRILTPHPGEFARLIQSDVETIEGNRKDLAVQFARKHSVVLLLKGQGTIITDGKRLAVNSTGNNGMATGGTGDVLTGLIGALLAQGMSAFEAAQLGAHLHGLAGDLAACALTKPALIASDLPKYLSAAWKALDE